MTQPQNASRHFPNQQSAQRVFSLCRYALGVLALSASLFAVIPAVHAQSGDTASRLKRLENDVDTLNRAVYKGEKPPPSMAGPDEGRALLQSRIDQLEKDVRDLTGKVEQQTYETQQLQQKFEAMSENSRMRFDALETQMRSGAGTAAVSSAAGAPVDLSTPAEQVQETYPAAPASAEQPPQPGSPGDAAAQDGLSQSDLNAAPDGATPASTSAAPTTEPAPSGTMDTTQPLGGAPVAQDGAALDAAALYERGFAEIKKNDNAAAEKTFAQFIKQYPNHALTPNAYYWLGETYYVRKNYDKASRTFAESYKKFPKGPKAADNLLKLGLSLAGKGQTKNACVALGQLKKEYPKGAPAVLKRGEDEMAALKCAN